LRGWPLGARMRATPPLVLAGAPDAAAPLRPVMEGVRLIPAPPLPPAPPEDDPTELGVPGPDDPADELPGTAIRQGAEPPPPPAPVGVRDVPPRPKLEPTSALWVFRSGISFCRSAAASVSVWRVDRSPAAVAEEFGGAARPAATLSRPVDGDRPAAAAAAPGGTVIDLATPEIPIGPRVPAAEDCSGPGWELEWCTP
jgi:hypothetical protein